MVDGSSRKVPRKKIERACQNWKIGYGKFYEMKWNSLEELGQDRGKKLSWIMNDEALPVWHPRDNMTQIHFLYRFKHKGQVKREGPLAMEGIRTGITQG